MAVETTFYRDLALVFGAAALGGGAAKALRQPLIVGYVIGGIVIGPFTPGPRVSGLHEFELLAEVGVILLMYSIGLEFSFRELLEVKWVAIFGAPLGILFSVLIGAGLGRVLGWGVTQGLVIGAIISVASTMVLSRFLADCGDLRSLHGRVMIGVTLVEDLAVVMLTVALPSFGNLGSGRLLSVALAAGKSLLLLSPIIVLAAWLVPKLLRQILRSGSEELYMLVVLALGFSTAAITQAVGLSLALGAFLAGMLVSEAEMTHKMMEKVLPLRDAFVALFFVTIGALVDPRVLISHPALWISIMLLTILGKFVIWTLVVWLFRYPLITAMLVGIGLTQIGEFSYVLVTVARDASLVGSEVYNATLAASVVTIVLNGLLMRKIPPRLRALMPA